MTRQVRLVLMLIVALAVMVLASCDHYTCKVTFGSSTCGSGGGGISQGGGGGGNAALAFGYYVSNTQVQSFELGPQASLLTTPGFVPPVLPTSPHSAMAIAQQQFLYLPYGTGQLFAWSIDGGSGALTALNGSPFTAPYAAGLAQASQPLTPIITHPSGNFLYIADTTDSLIYAFSIDPSTGLLTPVGSPFPSIVPPWNLATDGTGKFLYVSQGNQFGEGQFNMAVFQINSGTGALSAGTSMAFNMWQVQGEPTGHFMIGVDGETGLAPDQKLDKNLYVFPINQATGVLGTPTAVPTANGPVAVVVHPNGQFVYEFSIVQASGFDAPLEGFSLSAGVLTSMGAPFSSLTTIPYGGFFDQSGTYMFVHSSNAVGVLNVDPTTGIPTEPSTPIGIGSDGPWAITDVP